MEPKNCNKQRIATVTGPRTPEGKQIASRNSRKHGLLSQRLFFTNHAESAEYEELLSGIRDSFGPVNRLEEMLVEEIAICWWKLRIVTGLIESQIRDPGSRDVTDTIRYFARNSTILKIPLPGIRSSSSRDPDTFCANAWECEQLVLRLGNNEKERIGPEKSDIDDDESSISSADNYQVEIRMSDALDKMLRYETKIKRDLYRAIEQLHHLRELGMDR